MKKNEAGRELKVVGIGLLLGLSCVVFGVFWAVYITAYHEDIHTELGLAEKASIEEKFVLSGGGGHGAHGAAQGNGHPHMEGGHGLHGHEGNGMVVPDGTDAHAGHEMHGGYEGAHSGSGESRDMRAAHELLARAHVHAMGLGVLTISISLMLAFMPVSSWVRALAAASLGTGSFFYPLALIIAGLRTTALGEAGAAQSVFPMTVMSVLLAGAGLIMAAASLIVWLFRGNE